MAAIGKRLFNVLALLSTVYLLALLYGIIAGNVADWNVFLGINGRNLFLCYGGIAVLNYILFGKVTLWHRNPSGSDR